MMMMMTKCFLKQKGGGCLDDDLRDLISCLVENGEALFSIIGGDDDAEENHDISRSLGPLRRGP